MPKKCDIKIPFLATMKPLVSEKKDKYLFLASTEELKNFLPQIDLKTNVDLLSTAFSIFTANRGNLNKQIIGTGPAIQIANHFKYKPVNVEHEREKIIGVSLTNSFSEYGSNKLLSEDEVKDTKKPFNVTLGAVIWKIIAESLSELIEESADPESQHHNKIGSSWELGVSLYNLALLDKGKKNLEDAEIIDDEDQINIIEAEMSDKKIWKNKVVYQNVLECLPLASALTLNPASELFGVASESSGVKLQLNDPRDVIAKENNTEINKIVEIQAKKENSGVKENSQILTNPNIMFKNRKDITDETLKVATASAVQSIIDQELDAASKTWLQEKTKQDDINTKAKAEYDNLLANHQKLQESFVKAEASINELQAKIAEKEKSEKYNQRMASFDEKYELSDEDRKVLAPQIRDLNDEGYSAFEKSMSVLMKAKDKSVIATEKAAQAARVVVASTVQETPAQVVEAAIENAAKVTPTIPASTSSEESLADKGKRVFEYEFKSRKNR